MEKQKGVHNNSVSNVHFNTFVRRVRSHSLLDHDRVDHVVEHPWQVDLFLWQVAVSMVEGLKKDKERGCWKKFNDEYTRNEERQQQQLAQDCNVPLVLYLVDLFPCLVVHVHDREDLYLFQGAVQSRYVEDATMVGD